MDVQQPQEEDQKKDSFGTSVKVSFRAMFDFSLTSEERKNTINRLIEDSRADNAFYIMLLLSTVITVAGLLSDNVVAVLGGMLVAPLLTPILSFGMAIVTNQSVSLRRSFNTIAKSIILVLLISLLTTLLMNYSSESVYASKEISQRTSAPIISLFIALASGLAAAFAWAKPKLSAALPGVAVATSVLPPLAVSGIGIAFLDKDMIFGAFQLFITNLLVIAAASSVIFSLFGFFESRKEEEKKVVEEIKEIKEEKKEIQEEMKKEEEKADPNNPTT